MTDLSSDFVVLSAGMEGPRWQYDIIDEKTVAGADWQAEELALEYARAKWA
ncbi:hypothetical protein U9R80_06365 [Pseudomonas sp. JQ170C]|uniref:hypothetical protein n=1 Tax=Pseudomonas sp. JQ170C TaxID=3110111 RepID=UPI002D79992D|nr:hypothetical protein [Pseudomonas sp. 170C]WRO77301.1 hypothetical protein U9R80_06365 [Pseudomonas sp. 170C]